MPREFGDCSRCAAQERYFVGARPEDLERNNRFSKSEAGEQSPGSVDEELGEKTQFPRPPLCPPPVSSKRIGRTGFHVCRRMSDPR